MKQTSILFFSLCAIIALISSEVMGADTITITGPGTYSVGASIDGSCTPIPTMFVIAEGLVAKDMKVTMLTPGVNCMTGAVADTMGFEIEAGADVFTYSKFKGGPPRFSPMPLFRMVLNPSTYTLYAYGGRGASVVLEMTVAGSTTPGTPATTPGGPAVTPGGPAVTTPGGPTTSAPDTTKDTASGPSKKTPGAPPVILPTGADGRWNTDWWGVLTMTTTGNSVSGNYEESQGRITGTLSADGRTINGRWAEAPTYESPECAGIFELSVSPDGRSLTGWWTFGTSVEFKSDITGTRMP